MTTHEEGREVFRSFARSKGYSEFRRSNEYYRLGKHRAIIRIVRSNDKGLTIREFYHGTYTITWEDMKCQITSYHRGRGAIPTSSGEAVDIGSAPAVAINAGAIADA